MSAALALEKAWRERNDAMKRIAELEADLASERGLSSIQRDALDAQGRNLEKAEAELASVEAQRDDWTRLARARAEKAEDEVERLGTLLENREADIEYWRSRARGYRACAEKAEAEVERLKEALLDSKHWPHVVENIYDPMCVRCKGGGRESGANPRAGSEASREVGRERTGSSAAAEPAAPSLSARKATRKTDSCDGTTHTVVHADGNVCPFLIPRSP